MRQFTGEFRFRLAQRLILKAEAAERCHSFLSDMPSSRRLLATAFETFGGELGELRTGPLLPSPLEAGDQ